METSLHIPVWDMVACFGGSLANNIGVAFVVLLVIESIDF